MAGLLFLNIAWIKWYDDINGDKPVGGGGYVRKRGWGYEIFNFRPFQGILYGYAPARKSIELAHFGAPKGQESVADVLVVWVATKPKGGGRYVVGWYANARVFRKEQDAPPGCTNRLLPPDPDVPGEERKQASYWITADEDNGILLGVEERTVQLPPKEPGSMGQNPVWYAEGPTNAAFRQKVLEYIQRTQVANLAVANLAQEKKKYGPGGEGPEHKQLKEWCAQNWSNLGLTGVTGTHIEYKFKKTGDRADLAFELAGSRWAVVEVETDFAEPGAHQALKYRVLMCAQNGLPITSEKVEGWLVAYEVPPTVREFCKSYNLRWKEVPPEVVGPST